MAKLPQPQQNEGTQAYLRRIAAAGFETSEIEGSIPDLGRMETPPVIEGDFPMQGQTIPPPATTPPSGTSPKQPAQGLPYLPGLREGDTFQIGNQTYTKTPEGTFSPVNQPAPQPTIQTPPSLDAIRASSAPTEPMPKFSPAKGIGTRIGGWEFTAKRQWEWRGESPTVPVQKDMNKTQEQFQKAIQVAGANLASPSEVRNAIQEIKTAPGLTDTSTSELKIMLDKLEAMTPPTQDNLVATFKSIMAEQGIPELKTKLVDLEAIMEGTDDDIRAEIQKAGGFSTESQVQALVTQRNKTLMKEYNKVLNKYKIAQDYVDQILKFTGEDREQALKEFDRKFDLAKTSLGYQIQMENLKLEGKKEVQSNFQKQVTTLTNADAWDALPKTQKDFIWRMAGFGEGAPSKLDTKDSFYTYTDTRGNLFQKNIDTSETTVLIEAKTPQNLEPLNILDVARYKQLYPYAGIDLGDTQSSATLKFQQYQTGKVIPTDQLKAEMVKDKKEGITFDQILFSLNANTYQVGNQFIANKDEAKLIAAEVFKPKAGLIQQLFGGFGRMQKITPTVPETTPQYSQAIEGYFGDLNEQILNFNKSYLWQ